MPSVAFHTLGCKVNQYDTQAMLEAFLSHGYTLREFDETADVYVINTCTVTGTGDKKSLQMVRRALKTNPAAHVVIAGCLAQRDGEKLLETGARLVIGNAHRANVVELLEEAVEKNISTAAVEKDLLRVPFEPLKIARFAERTRAVLKIQEGCDRYCTYCIIPYVRGGIRSRKVEDIREEARRLANAGFEELVLTGIHLTSYGRDLNGETLLDAIDACMAQGVKRIRLGSLEPVIVTEEFARAIASRPTVCPQFHLALQSGSDTVLKRMRRRYTTEEFLTAASLLRKYMPSCAITTDVICGFPGETEEEFAQTMAFVKQVSFARMHVFPYSARKGTPAATMGGQVPKKIREERTRTLIRLGHDLAKAYHESMIGSTVEVLWEESDEDGFLTGYTREYVHCRARGTLRDTTPCLVRVISADADGLTGELL
ncbi:MAG: tRNA (N(6)-L-threonylcarbamoyladenosine(37)-C(2))-methylthiotransferase MtaB [Clostridiales bacterium]|nr:tRNA (N(6)-L-threonylcarbamoyladenosine(37)-C(2))-methylthiotransferase MtaB [Clostridiales bacterium]